MKRIVHLYLNTDKYSPLNGSQYLALPKWIKDKKAVVNVKNNNAECFKWAILSAVHHEEVDPKHTDRVNKYQSWKDELNFTGLEFPMEVDKIGAFEKLNPHYAINVFAWEVKDIYNVRISEFAEIQPRTTINLPLIEQEGRKHYAWIKNMSRLCSNQISDHNGEVKICCRCMQHFGDQEKLDDHLENCRKTEAMNIEMPEPGTSERFKNPQRAVEVPFVVFADFECFIEGQKTQGGEKSEGPYTETTHKHVPSGFAYYIHCFYEMVFPGKLELYSMQKEGEDVAQVFVEKLERDIKRLNNIPRARPIIRQQSCAGSARKR